MTELSVGHVPRDLTILDFWADWCGICRLIDPVLDRVVRGEDSVVLRKVNVAEARDMTEMYKVQTLPTLVFLSSDGRELGRLSGTMTGKQIEAALRNAKNEMA
jgi:thioredoxin 1